MDLKKVAILCNYELLSTRVGGMDYFFWQFDAKCKENNIQVDWFFPNTATHGDYPQLTIIDCKYQPTESYFLDYCVLNNPSYSSIVTHFIALCTPFFKKLKQLSSAKVIAVDHNPRPIFGYPIKKKIEKRLKGFLFSKHIDLFVGVSEYCKAQLISEFGSQLTDKITIIFNGLQTEKFIKKTSFEFKNRFIVASHLRKEKGIQDLIAAVYGLDNVLRKSLKIDIYGEGYYEAHLHEMIINFGLNEIFTFKGSVSNLDKIYHEYDYLIHPSHGETFCYSVVEALLCNLPVITTKNEGNVLNLIKEDANGFLYNAADSAQLTTILEGILLHDKSIENGLLKETKVLDLSLDQMVNNHFKVLA